MALIAGETLRHQLPARSDKAPLVLLGASAALLTFVAVYAFFRIGMDRSDFYQFYRSGSAWLTNSPLYPTDQNPNLNPPTTIVALFAPLAHLPYTVAQSIWLILGACGLAAAAQTIRGVLGLRIGQVLQVLMFLSVTYAAFLVWLEGQLTWLLLYPVTRAWVAWRTGRTTAAGLWLAPVIAVKPILALLPLALSWQVGVTAGLGSICLVILGIAWTGLMPWVTWLHVGAGVQWLSWPPNASLWGIAARLQSGRLSGVSIAALHPFGLAAVLAVALVCWARVIRERNRDRRFALAVLWTVLASPLGWIYYLPLGLGAMVASWPRSRIIWLAFACTLVPFHLIQGRFESAAVIRTVGCLYSAAVLCAFALWSTPAGPASAVDSRP